MSWLWSYFYSTPAVPVTEEVKLDKVNEQVVVTVNDTVNDKIADTANDQSDTSVLSVLSEGPPPLVPADETDEEHDHLSDHEVIKIKRAKNRTVSLVKSKAKRAIKK